MLLSHRSGLPNYMYFAEKYWPNQHNSITNEDVLCMLEQFKPNRYYIPNYRYNYCNTNYVMLSLLVKRVSGRPFHEFVETEIFKPLNMKTARVYDNVRQPEVINPTTGYERRRAVRDSYLNGVSGDKNIYASVHDLLKLDQALYNNTLIRRSTLEEALLPHHKDLYLHDNYGLGWRLKIRPDCSKVVYHTGWWKGYRTFFIRLPDEEKTAIVLSNTNRGRFISTRKLVEFMQYDPA
jgi:CubicO group peptidase (beta-lactamase class C family)